MSTKASKFLTLAFVSSLMPMSGTWAAELLDQARTSHGGVESKTKRHRFEAVFAKSGVKLYVHGADHKPVDVSHLSASATFYHPSSPNPWFSRKLRPAGSAGVLSQTRLSCAWLCRASQRKVPRSNS
jgi:hypothetical protein